MFMFVSALKVLILVFLMYIYRVQSYNILNKRSFFNAANLSW